MHLRARWFTLTLGIAAGCTPPPPEAPTSQVSAADAPAGVGVEVLDQVFSNDPPLPLDPAIKRGKLDNGLTYFILPHQKPEKRAHFWLAVNAGSVLEDDDQRGLAHFVEHMCFNGTKRFPKQELVSFLERSGMRFGADLNAFTSFDETVYQLQVPTDKPELVHGALSILRDFADGVTFDPVEVDKERGVVLEEWRLGRGAGTRIRDKQTPILFNGSKYAERSPIGKPEILKGASRDTVVRFYRDWYRPDLMAVIAVGDFTPADIEARIKSEFASLRGPESPRPRPNVPVPPHTATLVTVETDAETTAPTVLVASKLPHRSNRSARDMRRALAERLFSVMLNSRFDEIRRKPDAPFSTAVSMTSPSIRPIDMFQQVAVVKEGGVQGAFGSLLEEVLRVERHGFVASELERARSQVLRGLEQSAKERDKRDAKGFASEILSHFLKGESVAGAQADYELAERLVPTIGLEEVNGLAKSLSAGSRVIAITGPAAMAKPTSGELREISRGVAARDIQPYQDGVSSVPLMAKAPERVPVASTKSVPELGITEWRLKNGARVIVKPTTFKNDEVRMTAFSPGGHSRVPDADFDSARFASTIVGQGGLGSLNAVALRKSLAGKVVSVSASVGELQEGLSGAAAPRDLETLFQAIHLSFTAPRRDEAAFNAWRSQQADLLKNRRASPDVTFLEEMIAFETQNHPRRRPVTPEALQKVDLDKALAIYRDRFADAGDFTFVFVGNLELEPLKALVESYLGSLPSRGRKETWRDVGVTLPKGVAAKTVTQGKEPKSQVSLVFHGDQKWSRDASTDLALLSEVLRIRLREVLREDMGGVYGVRINGSIARRPKQRYALNVGFGCAPENVDKLKQAVFDEAKALQENGIGEEYLGKIREIWRRAHETNLKENAFWVRELERAYDYGDDPRLILDVSTRVERATSANVRAAAKKYLNPKQYVFGVLKPES